MNGQNNPPNVEDGLEDGLRMALMIGEKENTKEEGGHMAFTETFDKRGDFCFK